MRTIRTSSSACAVTGGAPSVKRKKRSRNLAIHADVGNVRVVEHLPYRPIPRFLVEAARRDLRAQGEPPGSPAARFVLQEPEQRDAQALAARVVQHRHPPDAGDARLDEDESPRAGGNAIQQG